MGLKVSLAYPLVSDLNPASCVQEVLIKSLKYIIYNVEYLF